MRNRKKNRKNWGVLSCILFLIGFFGIHTIIFKNFILEPAGLTGSVHILGLEISPAEVILNAFNMLWGMFAWHSVKQAVL